MESNVVNIFKGVEDGILKCADTLDECFVGISASYGKRRPKHQFRDAYLEGYNRGLNKDRENGI